MGWIFELEHFRENLGFGEGGETGAVNDWQRRGVQGRHRTSCPRSVSVCLMLCEAAQTSSRNLMSG